MVDDWQSCCDKLNEWLRIAPYQSPHEFDDEDEDFDTSKGLRIMSIAFKAEKLVKVLYLHSIAIRTHYNSLLYFSGMWPVTPAFLMWKGRSWTSFVYHIS